jgi:hypothetical protein
MRLVSYSGSKEESYISAAKIPRCLLIYLSACQPGDEKEMMMLLFPEQSMMELLRRTAVPSMIKP